MRFCCSFQREAKETPFVFLFFFIGGGLSVVQDNSLLMISGLGRLPKPVRSHPRLEDKKMGHLTVASNMGPRQAILQQALEF